MRTRRAISILLLVVSLMAACTQDAAMNPAGRNASLASDRPTCKTIDIASDDYGTEIHPNSGPSGAEVTLSGTTVRGEDGRWAPSGRLEAWWNTQIPEGEGSDSEPLKPGSPIVQLLVVEHMERCRFETVFEIPEALPGRYKISVFAWEENPDGGYGFFPPHHFTVTER